MATAKDVQIPNIINGMIRSEIMDDSVAPEDSCELSVNFSFDRVGASTTRLGLTTFATQRGGAIISLGSFSRNSSGVRKLLVQEGNTIYSWDGASYTSVRTLSNSNKARYSQFLNYVYTVNGHSGDPIQTFDGTSYSATNVGSLPKGDFVQAGYGGRVWVGDNDTDRVYYTDIVSPSGSITGGAGYIEKLSPQDGFSMTALVRHPRALLVFKQDYIIRVYSPSAYDLYPAYFVGTYSQESVVSTKAGIFFHHSSGFYQFQYDGQPQEISRRIYPIIKAIPRSQYEKIFSWEDPDHVYWAIGNITLSGVSYQNVVCVYTISTKVWSIFSYRKQLNCVVKYDTGTVLENILGTEDGYVPTFNSGFTDLSEDIYFELITRWMGFGDVYKLKQAKGFAVQHLNGGSVECSSQINKETSNTWEKLIGLTDAVVDTNKDCETKEFNKLRLRYSGYTSGTQIVLQNAKFLLVEDKGITSSDTI